MAGICAFARYDAVGVEGNASLAVKEFEAVDMERVRSSAFVGGSEPPSSSARPL